MASYFRLLAACCAVVALLLSPARAAAWIELSTRSDSVTVEVARDGRAVVTHEMVLRVRGGPLKDIVLDGVDEDAEPLPDATITRAHAGRAAGLPIPLSLSVSESALTGHIEYKKGVRTGTYLVRLGYRTDLARAGGIRAAGARAEVRWQTPRFDSGIDSMRVLFRFPVAANPPALPRSGTSDATTGLTEEFDGVFLATARRSGDRDELEIIRPHVAKGEAAVWRAHVDVSAFDLPLVEQGHAASPPTAPLAAPSMRREPESAILPWAIASLAALFYGLLLFSKARLVGRAHARAGAVERPLVPMRSVPRVLLAGLCFGGAVIVALVPGLPTIAGILLLASLALASFASPEAKTLLRGPGQWKRIEPKVAFDGKSDPKLPGRVLDVGAPAGFSLFCVLLSGFVVLAFVVMVRSTYHGVAVLLASTVLFPVFCTGRPTELASGPLSDARRLLAPLFAALSRSREFGTVPLARFPLAREEADELRLLVEPRRPRRGLIAIEIGVEPRRGGGFALPFFVVRVTEGTPSAEALPKGLLWTRGRQIDERVAVVRPRLPTRRAMLALTQKLVLALAEPAPSARRHQKKAAKSAGKGTSTAKPSTVSPPAHAM